MSDAVVFLYREDIFPERYKHCSSYLANKTIPWVCCTHILLRSGRLSLSCVFDPTMVFLGTEKQIFVVRRPDVLAKREC